MADKIFHLTSDFTYNGFDYVTMHNGYVLAYKSSTIYAYEFNKDTNTYTYKDSTTGGVPDSNDTYIASSSGDYLYLHSFNGTSFTTEDTVNYNHSSTASNTFFGKTRIDSNGYVYTGWRNHSGTDYIWYVDAYTSSGGALTKRDDTSVTVGDLFSGAGGYRNICAYDGTFFVVKQYGETYPANSKCDSVRVFTFDGSSITYQTYYQPPYVLDNGPTDYGYSQGGDANIETDGTYIVYSNSISKWYGTSPWDTEDLWTVLAAILEYSGGSLSLVDELLQRRDEADLWSSSIMGFTIGPYKGGRLIYRRAQKNSYPFDEYPYFIKESSGSLSTYIEDSAVYAIPDVSLPDHIGLGGIGFDSPYIHGYAEINSDAGTLSAYYIGEDFEQPTFHTGVNWIPGIQ